MSEAGQPYRLRFFFDAGSGVCLWSQNEAAKQRFGYAVELDSLDLPAGLAEEAERLISDYDATIDWSDPARLVEPDRDAVSFGYERNAPLRDQVRSLLPRLRAALGADFEIESDFEG
ncbi:MAG TPA: hypothetical protein VG942_09500 [Hyphomonadaceae bacterium]|nr:hypothetical protein [Hyphomonadaceae bacterium]